MNRAVLRTQLSGVARRPSRLLLSGLAVLVASFVVYSAVLAQQITERSALQSISGTPAAVDLVVGDGTVTTGELAKLRAIPGVAEAVGRTEQGGPIGGQYLSVVADPGTGPLALAHVEQGAWPSKPGEIAVTERTADRMGLPVGSTITITTDYDDAGRPAHPVKLTVVGLAVARDDWGSVAYAPQALVSELFKSDQLERVEMHLAAGATAQDVRSAVDQIVAATPVPADGQRATVQSGDEIRRAETEAAVSDINALFAAVGMFVAVAVIAAGLVATSTFRIVFAQRMRQLALLRAVGAGRGSITRSLAVEGALTGLVAGITGVLLAAGLGQAVPLVVRAFGAQIAAPGVPLLPALAVTVLAVIITVLAVLAPAASAAKVAPLEALRSASTTGGKQGIGKLRGAFGLLLVVGAGLLAAYVLTNLPGRDPEDYDATPMLAAVVGSGALTFLALIALGPLLVRPVLAVLGWPVRRFGPLGRLAVGGLGGAPRRAAAVSVVVALGVTLIAGVLVAGASFQVLIDRETAAGAPADYEVTTGDQPVSEQMLTQARARPELTHVVGYRRLGEVTADGAVEQFSANDLDLTALPELKKLDTVAGTLGDLGPGKVVLSGWAAQATGLQRGQALTLHAGKHDLRLTVAAVLPDSAPLHTDLVLTPADLSTLGAKSGYDGLLADATATGEAARTAGQAALLQATGNQPGYGITVLADQRDRDARVLGSLLAVVVGLISLTVLIAVVGVGTTTALSVVERVRESGLLRAVGLSRGGLRAMLTTESSLYGVIGAAIGLLLGVPYAWLAVGALGVNAPIRLPGAQLAVVFGVLVVLTAIAGLLPARRAAKVSPVTALGTD